MNEQEIFDELRDLLTEHLAIDEEQVKPDSTLDDFGADSLDFVEIIVKCEDNFDVNVVDDEAEVFTKSIAEIVKYLYGKINP